jgi:hypothetical protein
MDLTAAEVMRRSVTSVPSTLPLPELERAFIELRVSGFPVDSTMDFARLYAQGRLKPA